MAAPLKCAAAGYRAVLVSVDCLTVSTCRLMFHIALWLHCRSLLLASVGQKFIPGTPELHVSLDTLQAGVSRAAASISCCTLLTCS